jgi:hypothetical protein
MAALSDAADAVGLTQSLGFALMNVAIGPGFVVGSAVGGAIAAAVGDRPPFLAIAAFAALALVAVVRPRLEGYARSLDRA